MERFCFGRGLFILRQGRTLHFSHRAGSTLYFEEPGTGETEAIEKKQFWCEVEQRQISVLAQALRDPAPGRFAHTIEKYFSSAFSPEQAWVNMDKPFPTHNELERSPQAAPPRVNPDHGILIAKVIRCHVVDSKHIPISLMYGMRYLPALAQLNEERTKAGLEELRPISTRTFRRRVAALVPSEHGVIHHSPRPRQKFSETPHVFAPPNQPGDRQDRSATQSSKHEHRDVLLLPLGELRVTAIVDRYSRCILGLRVQFHGPTRDSNPGQQRTSE